METYFQWKANRKSYVACRMAPVLVTLNDLEGHFPRSFPFCRLFKCNSSHICAAFYQISTVSFQGPVWRDFLLALLKDLFCLFVCSVKLFSAVDGPIGAKFGMRHEPDARQVLRDFGGATPRDGEIIAQNVKIRARMGPKCQIKFANSGKTMRRSVSPS